MGCTVMTLYNSGLASAVDIREGQARDGHGCLGAENRPISDLSWLSRDRRLRPSVGCIIEYKRSDDDRLKRLIFSLYS